MKYFLIATIIIAVVVAAYLKTPQARGKIGENRVKMVVNTTLKKQYIINDLRLTNDSKTAQIDHVVINPRGVFVIETKNYSGLIYGSEKQHEWTQVLAYGNVKNKLYNPLKQNASHVYNVKKIIGDLPVRSLVVFVQNNTEYIDAPNVIPLSELKSTLNAGEDILSDEEMEKAYNLLLAYETDFSNKEHIANIKEQQRNLELGICPRCGGELVLRNGKHGEFWGCSNYPNCRFTKKK